MKARRKWSTELRSTGARAQRLTNLGNTFSMIADDLLHTDLQGALRLYALTGDLDDPVAKLAGTIPTNYSLVSSLQAAYDNKTLPVNSEILGFAMAGTAVRHLTFKEYRERQPDDFKQVLERVRSEAEITAKDEKQFEKKAIKLMERFYNTQILPGLPPPPQMPDKYKVKALVVTVLMRDGFSMVIRSDKPEGQANVNALEEDDIYGNPDFSALWQFLHGVRPDLDERARERVEDAKVTAALMNDLDFDVDESPEAE